MEKKWNAMEKLWKSYGISFLGICANPVTVLCLSDGIDLVSPREHSWPKWVEMNWTSRQRTFTSHTRPQSKGTVGGIVLNFSCPPQFTTVSGGGQIRVWNSLWLNFIFFNFILIGFRNQQLQFVLDKTPCYYTKMKCLRLSYMFIWFPFWRGQCLPQSNLSYMFIWFPFFRGQCLPQSNLSYMFIWFPFFRGQCLPQSHLSL